MTRPLASDTAPPVVRTRADDQRVALAAIVEAPAGLPPHLSDLAHRGRGVANREAEVVAVAPVRARAS